jgi:hypothetical protein
VSATDREAIALILPESRVVEEIDRELIEPLGQATASLLLLEEDAASIAASLGFQAKNAARRALRMKDAPLAGAQDKLHKEPATGATEGARDTAVRAVAAAMRALSKGQDEYREALWITDELTRVGLEQLNERLSELRGDLAAAQSVVNRFLALREGSEKD